MTAAVRSPATSWPRLPVGLRVHVLVDAADSAECVRELAARHDLAAGVVICHPTPGSVSLSVLAQDVLVALGKRPGSLAREGLRPRGWALAGQWLRAERVRHLIVLRAHLLPADHWRQLSSPAPRAASPPGS